MTKRRDLQTERFHERQQREKAYRAQLPKEDGEQLPPPAPPIRTDAGPKRNAPCPCGSGKKYKQCCGKGAR